MQGLMLLSQFSFFNRIVDNGMCYHFLYGKLQVSLALKGE